MQSSKEEQLKNDRKCLEEFRKKNDPIIKECFKKINSIRQIENELIQKIKKSMSNLRLCSTCGEEDCDSSC